MPILKERISELVSERPGLTDREITNVIKGRGEPQQPVNQACRRLEAAGMALRRRRDDGLIGNYPMGKTLAQRETARTPKRAARTTDALLSEDEVKGAVHEWLEKQGWTVDVAWGQSTGIDIEARKSGQRWIIEAKGCGSYAQMRRNYFLGLLGAIVQRMDDSSARYSIALPDMRQFRGLWGRLPRLAKERLGVTALFVGADGRVSVEG